jgi:hypothetical protein
MFDLGLFYRNPFEDNNISDGHLKRFTEDHLGMITENNKNGQFTTIIADTVTAYNEYFGNNADKNTTAEVQTQLNQSMKSSFEEFITQVTENEPKIKALWGLDSSQYREFYPAGLPEYNNASLADVEEIMTRYINSANNHIQELGQGFVDIFNGIRTNFLAAREAQLKKISEPGVVPVKSSNRKSLERQLMKNIHTFAIVYLDNPEQGIAFFNTNILTSPDTGPAVSPVTEPAVEQQRPIK